MSRTHGPVGLAIEWSPRGVVAYDATSRKTTTAVDLPSLDLGSRDAVLALSRRGVFVRTARVPDAAAGDVRMILMMQVGELFPLPPIDLAWDFALTDDVTSEGRLAVVAAVPCTDLRRALDAASAAGLRVQAAVPLAVGATLLAQEMGLAEAVVVESAQDGPAVDVVSGGALRATRAAPPTTPLELEVTRALGLAGMDQAPVVAAGGADIPSAAHRSDRTALMALADSPIERLNLLLELPEAVAARTASAGRRRVRLASLVLVFGVVAALISASGWYDAVQNAKSAEASSSRRITALRNAGKKTITERDRVVAMRDALKGAFAPAQKPSEIFAVVTASVPPGAWLKGVTFERGRPLSIRGTAKTTNAVATFLKNLNEGVEGRFKGRFRDVASTNVNNAQENKVPVTEFVVTAFPVGNLPFLSRSKTGR